MITYDSDTFKQLKNVDYELSDHVIEIISKLVIKPSLITKYVKKRVISYNKSRNRSNKVINQNNNNGWRTVTATHRPVIGKPIKTELEKIERMVNSLLNKLTKDNFTVIFCEIKTLLSKNKQAELFSYIIKNIFNKSILQPNYCPTYVRLYTELISFDDVFKKEIILICERYFEMIKYKDNLKETIKDDNYNSFCLIVKNKSKKKGFSQFVGELYLKKILSIDKINQCTSILINNVKQILEGDEVELLENNILCLSQLLETVRKDIRNIDSINDYLKDIYQFSKNSKLIKRLQFKLMDLLNLFK